MLPIIKKIIYECYIRLLKLYCQKFYNLNCDICNEDVYKKFHKKIKFYYEKRFYELDNKLYCYDCVLKRKDYDNICVFYSIFSFNINIQNIIEILNKNNEYDKNFDYNQFNNKSNNDLISYYNKISMTIKYSIDKVDQEIY